MKKLKLIAKLSLGKESLAILKNQSVSQVKGGAKPRIASGIDSGECLPETAEIFTCLAKA